MELLQIKFDNMKKNITLAKAQEINAIYLFTIGEVDTEYWLVDLTKKSDWISKVEEGEDSDCECIIPNVQDFYDMLDGELNPMKAFMEGSVKIKGNTALAFKLGDLLK